MMFNKNKLLACLLCVAIILSLCACGEQKKEEKKETPKPEVYEETYYGDLVRNAYIEYNGTKIDAPFTVQQLIDAGLAWNTEEQANEIVPVYNMSSENSILKIPDSESVVHFVAHNLGKEDASIKDCYVTLLTTNSDKITINGVTPYKTTYENVIQTFGKDVSERQKTYEEEVKVCYEEGRRLDMEYLAKGKDQKIGDRNIADFILKTYVAVDKNIINYVSLQVRE